MESTFLCPFKNWGLGQGSGWKRGTDFGLKWTIAIFRPAIILLILRNFGPGEVLSGQNPASQTKRKRLELPKGVCQLFNLMLYSPFKTYICLMKMNYLLVWMTFNLNILFPKPGWWEYDPREFWTLALIRIVPMNSVNSLILSAGKSAHWRVWNITRVKLQDNTWILLTTSNSNF